MLSRDVWISVSCKVAAKMNSCNKYNLSFWYPHNLLKISFCQGQILSSHPAFSFSTLPSCAYAISLHKLCQVSSYCWSSTFLASWNFNFLKLLSCKYSSHQQISIFSPCAMLCSLGFLPISQPQNIWAAIYSQSTWNSVFLQFSMTSNLLWSWTSSYITPYQPHF